MPPLILVSTPLQIASGANNACALTPDPVAPEFLVSLNDCTPPSKAAPQLPESTKTIEAILEHIVTRLNGSLDPIWSPPHGQDPCWLPRAACTPEENERIQADEEWARWCTELMVGTGYGGVSEYGSGDFDDVRFFRAFEDRPGDRAERKDQPLDDAEKARAPNPLVPVKMACQQLCTYAYYSRGIPFDKVMSQGTTKPAYGVTASANAYLKHLFDGGWDDEPKYANLTEAFGRQKGRMTPGSILGFLPHGATTQTKGSHVAFVLRTAPHVLKAQFFDTGAVLEQGNGSRSKAGVKAPAAAAFNGGNYDDRLFEKVVGVWNSGVPVDCVGFGALSAIPPPKILAGVRTARRARPLGMARLAIFRRTKNNAVQAQDLLYVSPRVWMHDTATDVNYYISRYLWSLRGTPGHENLEVLWQVAHPANQGKDAFATECFRATREVPLRNVWGNPKQQRSYTAFLALSNDERGHVYLRQRVKLNPKRPKGQKLEKEGDGRYDQVIEYVYTTTNKKDPAVEDWHTVRGIFFKVPPGEAWLADTLSGQKFNPPPYFAPW